MANEFFDRASGQLSERWAAIYSDWKAQGGTKPVPPHEPMRPPVSATPEERAEIERIAKSWGLPSDSDN